PFPFPATPFVSDIVIRSKRAIQVVGWSPDGSRLAYTSLDVALNLPRGLEQLYSSDLSGAVVTDEGPMARPSLVQPNGFNPQHRPAAAWTRSGLVKQIGSPDAYGVASTEPNAVAIPTLPLYSIPVDAAGNAYILGSNGAWQRDDGSTIAQL